MNSATGKVDEVVGDAGLNLLINNAGIFPETPYDRADRALVAKVFDVNSISPLIVSQVCAK